MRLAETLYNAGDDEKPRFYSFIVAGNLEFAETRIAEFRVPLAIALALAGLGCSFARRFSRCVMGSCPCASSSAGSPPFAPARPSGWKEHCPAEIDPLQTELNQLMLSNQEIIERARTQVGNLAHALKTPLAVITNEAKSDTSATCQKIAEQAEVMRDPGPALPRSRPYRRPGSVPSAV